MTLPVERCGVKRCVRYTSADQPYPDARQCNPPNPHDMNIAIGPRLSPAPTPALAAHHAAHLLHHGVHVHPSKAGHAAAAAAAAKHLHQAGHVGHATGAASTTHALQPLLHGSK